MISSLQRPLPEITQHSQQTDIHAPVVFEPTISAGQRPQTYALDRAATGTRSFTFIFHGVIITIIIIIIIIITYIYCLLLLQSAQQPLVGFRPAQLPLSILSRKVLQSVVASGTSNPQLGGEPNI
jgi:hypothetical protein